MNESQTATMGLIMKAERAHRKAQQEISLSLLLDVTIDEVSLLFATQEQLDNFVKVATKLGMEHFNGVSDTLDRLDDGGCFGVRFEFLRWPESDWRIEAMCIAGSVEGTDLSIAPLHSAALDKAGSAPVLIHASFKLPTLDVYEAYRDRMDRMFAAVGGRRAEYRNTYGQFSYFGGGTSWYYKPRVNLRD